MKIEFLVCLMHMQITTETVFVGDFHTKIRLNETIYEQQMSTRQQQLFYLCHVNVPRSFSLGLPCCKWRKRIVQVSRGCAGTMITGHQDSLPERVCILR